MGLVRWSIPGTDMPSRIRGFVMAIVVASLIGAGVGYAVIPGSDGTISACYAKKNGALRVIDGASEQCGADEAALTLNETGPRGEPGPPGGVTTVLQRRSRSVAGVDDEAVVVAVPAGSYLVTASATLENQGAALPAFVTCRIVSSQPGTGVASDGALWSAVTGLEPRTDGIADTGWRDSISATAAMAVDAPAEVRLVCSSSAYPSASPVVIEALLTASAVG